MLHDGKAMLGRGLKQKMFVTILGDDTMAMQWVLDEIT